jgi:hypothetical protein
MPLDHHPQAANSGMVRAVEPLPIVANGACAFPLRFQVVAVLFGDQSRLTTRSWILAFPSSEKTPQPGNIWNDKRLQQS